MLYFYNLAGAIYDAHVEGIELPSLSDARIMAAKHAGEILKDSPHLVWKGEELRVEVTDSRQRVLFTVIVLGVEAPASSGEG